MLNNMEVIRFKDVKSVTTLIEIEAMWFERTKKLLKAALEYKEVANKLNSECNDEQDILKKYCMALALKSMEMSIRAMNLYEKMSRRVVALMNMSMTAKAYYTPYPIGGIDNSVEYLKSQDIHGQIYNEDEN